MWIENERLDERVDYEDRGNQVILKVRSGTLDDDDLNDIINAIDLLLDMLSGSKVKSKFKLGSLSSRFNRVKVMFDKVADEVREQQNSELQKGEVPDGAPHRPGGDLGHRVPEPGAVLPPRRLLHGVPWKGSRPRRLHPP